MVEDIEVEDEDIDIIPTIEEGEDTMEEVEEEAEVVIITTIMVVEEEDEVVKPIDLNRPVPNQSIHKVPC